MKTLTVLILLMLISGCLGNGSKDWKRAALEYTCSDEEHKKVEREAVFCSNNTGYYPSYCYGSAIIRNCKRIDQDYL